MEQTFPQRLKWQAILFLARRLPPCKVLLPLVSEARERPLTMREKITLKLHLFTCEACRRYVAQVEKMGEMVKSKTEETNPTEPADKLSENARNRIKTALEAAIQRKN